MHDLLGRSLSTDLAISNDVQVIGNGSSFGDIMGDDDGGQAKRLVEAGDQGGQHAHGNRVLAGKRLVIHDQLGIENNGACQCRAPRHAARQFRRHQLAGATQADSIKFHQHQVANHVLRQAGVNPQREGDIFVYRQVGEQGATLEQHAHAPAQAEQVVAAEPVDVLAVDPYGAGGRCQLAANQAQQCGLAATTGPHDGADRAAWNIQIDVVKQGAVAPAYTDVANLDQVVAQTILHHGTGQPVCHGRGYAMTG